MKYRSSHFILLNNTDEQWKKFGKLFPYFGVISETKYRKNGLDDKELLEFFKTGKKQFLLTTGIIKKFLKPDFAPKKSLDFGCGVGRMLVPISRISGSVLGVDISGGMLEEARKNCEHRSIKNASFSLSDDALSRVRDKFDFIFCCKVFQHIPPKRGEIIFDKLLDKLDSGGVGVFDFCYQGAPNHTFYSQLKMKVKSFLKNEPLMIMYNYNLNNLFGRMQNKEIDKLYVEVFDEGHGHFCIDFFLLKK